jgi:hypothetical protein
MCPSEMVLLNKGKQGGGIWFAEALVVETKVYVKAACTLNIVHGTSSIWIRMYLEIQFRRSML